jgi:hypothetical protein
MAWSAGISKVEAVHGVDQPNQADLGEVVLGLALFRKRRAMCQVLVLMISTTLSHVHAIGRRLRRRVPLPFGHRDDS